MFRTPTNTGTHPIAGRAEVIVSCLRGGRYDYHDNKLARLHLPDHPCPGLIYHTFSRWELRWGQDFQSGMAHHQHQMCASEILFICGISLTSGPLFNELFPERTRSCFSQVILRGRGGDLIYEMRCLFVAVGPNACFIVLPHWDNMS